MEKIISNLILISFFLVLSISCTSEAKNSKDNNSESSVNSDLHKIEFKTALQFTTAENRNKPFELSENLLIADFNQPEEHFPTIILDAQKRFQTIEGFGGALTDASAETFYKLPVKAQNEILEAYFDKEKGIGYNLCRTTIHSCDFSSESYAYAEVEDDKSLSHFSIQHDQKYRIPFIKAVIQKAGNEFRLFASPWSPPAWMKTNNNMLEGGSLKPEYFQTWADYFVKFFEAYQQNDIDFWGLTIQNEPMASQRWESCIYSAEEERDFVKNFLGPTLEKKQMGDKKIIVWDHNRGIMYQRAKVIFDDPEAAKYVWGTGFHWYTGDHFENVKLVNEAFPDKKTIFTEGCVFPFDKNKVNEWQWGERYGKSIIMDLNNSASAWVDWNVLLDENGGPNHVANYCFAPIIADTKSGKLTYMSSYYYLGHFSKFIRPGAQRIICSSNNDELLATAFINKDNSIALVVMNQANREFQFKIWLEGKGTLIKMPQHSISTIVINEVKGKK